MRSAGLDHLRGTPAGYPSHNSAGPLRADLRWPGRCSIRGGAAYWSRPSCGWRRSRLGPVPRVPASGLTMCPDSVSCNRPTGPVDAPWRREKRGQIQGGGTRAAPTGRGAKRIRAAPKGRSSLRWRLSRACGVVSRDEPGRLVRRRCKLGRGGVGCNRPSQGKERTRGMAPWPPFAPASNVDYDPAPPQWHIWGGASQTA